MSPELLIRNGTIVDGTGADRYQADVVVEGGRISELGRFEYAEADRVIDASGLYVAPGFIDIHSHSDYTLLVDPRAVSAIHQGVTLEVVGNCGFGCFPFRDRAMAPMAIYGFSGDKSLDWDSADGYFEAVDASRPAVNVMSLAPNGQLRLSTMGMKRRPAESHEIDELKRELEVSLDAGACGYSTGLEYAWESGASEDEIVELCKVSARAGGLYATHTRRREEGATAGIEEAIRTAMRAGVQLQVSHICPRTGRADLGRCMDCVDEAFGRGLDIGFDMHTRLFGLTYLHVALPPEAVEGGPERLRELLASRAAREDFKTYRSLLTAGGASWEKIVLFDNPVWPEYARRDIASIAAERGTDPLDAVFDLLAGAAENTRELMVILLTYTEDQQRDVFSHPRCIPASDATTLAPDGPLSDAFFHGAYTWASWFYRFMVRENKLLTPEEAIHRMTGLPARTLNLSDRGVLRPGGLADIAVFDPDAFTEVATTYSPNELASGMRHVVVNGVLTLSEGELTGQRAGMAIRV